MKLNLYLGLSFSLMLLYSCQSKTDLRNLRIATAASMQFPMQEIINAFEAETNIKADVILGSSGKLSTQIIEGAPFDVFVAADMDFPKKIQDAGFSKNAPKLYAKGKLVFWSNDERFNVNTILEKTPSKLKLAIANPKIAPYGKAAKEVLLHLDLWETIEKDLVFGESVAQVNQFILSKAATGGYTSLASLKAPVLKDAGEWRLVDESWYSPIMHGMLIIKNKSLKQKEAQQFYDFMFQADAQKILKNYGFECQNLEE